MSTELPRLKPDPVPPIRPVPEYLADEALRAVYEDTKTRLQVPWMGVVTMAFAAYPQFYAALWGGMRELAGSAEFVAASRAVRDAAEREAASLGPAELAGDLSRLGYAPRELDEIRALIEVFSHGNMPYLLIATAGRLLLEGETLSEGRAATPFAGRHGPSTGSRLTLIEAHHADAPTQAVYAGIRDTLGLPFVNTDYRALARWPSYFARAWADLAPKVPTRAYEAAVARVHAVAVAQMRALPNPGALTPDVLRAAAGRDASVDEVLAVVRLFQWLLPGLTVNVAYFREQLGAP